MKKIEMQLRNFVSCDCGSSTENIDIVVLNFEEERFFISQKDAKDLIIDCLKVLAAQGDMKALEVGKAFFEDNVLPDELAVIDQIQQDQKMSVENHTCITCGKDMPNEGFTLYENIIGFQCMECHEKE